MANQSLAGTPLPRTSAPLVTRGVPNGNGLYPWSAFSAKLVEGAGAFEPSVFDTADTPVNLLLFTADVPIQVSVIQQPINAVFFGATELPRTPFLVEQSSNNFRVMQFNALTTQPNGGVPVTFDFGVPGVGYIGTVPCSGYGLRGTLSTFNLVTEAEGGTPISRLVSIDVVSNGAVISGYPNLLSSSLLISSDFSAVILRASDYTQAIRDADNVISFELSGDRYTYQVVGLWALDPVT